MNLQTKMPTTADEFLRWEGDGVHRWEFCAGRAIRLPRDATRNHAGLATNLAAHLHSRLDRDAFDIALALLAVRTPAGIRMPDVVVDGDAPGSDVTARTPWLIAEVLSEESRDRDFGDKLLDYQGVRSLGHYLILSQDEPRVWLWSRGTSEEWGGPLEIYGAEEQLELSQLGVSIPLSEIYSGILARRPS